MKGNLELSHYEAVANMQKQVVLEHVCECLEIVNHNLLTVSDDEIMEAAAIADAVHT